MATHRARHAARTGWVAWVYFAGIVLAIAGVVQFVNGLFALARPDATVLTATGATVAISYTGVGVSFLVFGALLVATGVGVLTAKTWARVLAVALAVLSLLANVALFAAYPVWSAVVIVLDVLVIYALSVHGREVRR